MASKLCCTAEEDSRSGSPALPNVRVSEATPAKWPLLPKHADSPNSHFTSARSEDLHELRQIFDNAKEDDTHQPSPARAGRSRFIRPSVYSLHSLHKMKSMHSMIRQKFSRELSKKSSDKSVKSKKERSATPAASETVLKQPKGRSNKQLKITKDDLRKDLLSDKKPDEGGYDSDAQVLDDIAKNIGKRTPNKRPSIHSIDWTPSTASKPIPGSSSQSRHSDRVVDVPPYQINKPHTMSLSARFGQVFSSPNLQVALPKTQERILRRSHSASSLVLPEPSPLSPLRLPSLKTSDHEGVPWSEALNESLRLSQFPIPPSQVVPKQSRPSLKVIMGSRDTCSKTQAKKLQPPHFASQSKSKEAENSATVFEIHVQEPTTTSTPRTSNSIRGPFRENVPTTPQEALKNAQSEEDEAENPRTSVHLYSMRISHHLRSGSLLSWEQLANAPELPTSPRALRDRSISDLSRISQVQKQITRHERQTSSSGFASSKVPSKWGRVLPNELREDKSSIYSSRPQSPPDSSSTSMVNLTQTVNKHSASKNSSVDLTKPRRSSSYPTDNDETPRPAPRQGLTNLRDVTSSSALNRRSNETTRLARNNSVASTKKSKFREEFSPSPPKKRLMHSASIMRFLNPKRSSIRSQSEASIKPPGIESGVDGSLEAPHAATQRERQQSRSTMSLETEQGALGKDKKANPVWERALKNYQDERAAMFLPENKDLAPHSNPHRERRPSSAQPRPSMEEEGNTPRKLSSAKRFSAPLLDLPSFSLSNTEEPPLLSSRRTAFVAQDPDDISPGQEMQIRFHQQGDTAEVVGAWGRYPSHTRSERALSAGHLDSIETRDFALEAAIKFALGKSSGTDEDNIDPVSRPLSPPLLPGQRRRKKRIGNSRVAKSHSMTFGKTFLKNYTKIFRSQSIEFQKHGHGHRSSITAGGTLDYPELEILPDVWRRGITEERSSEQSNDSNEKHAAKGEIERKDTKGKGKMKEGDSASTLRPLKNIRQDTSNLMPTLDGPADQKQPRDTARVWSAYYENCLPSYPRASTDLNFRLEDFGGPARHSLESKRPSLHSQTLPVRSAKHSRNASRVSRLSVASVRPSFISFGEDDGIAEARSMVSVRRSTMDLITLYKEQEDTEREKVLGLMRMESKREAEGLLGS